MTRITEVRQANVAILDGALYASRQASDRNRNHVAVLKKTLVGVEVIEPNPKALEHYPNPPDDDGIKRTVFLITTFDHPRSGIDLT